MPEAVLEFEIIIDTSLSDDTKKNLEELKSSKESSPGGEVGQEDVPDATDVFSQAQQSKLESMFGEKFGGVDKADLAQMGSMARNPQGFLTKIFKSGATKILGPIAIALIAIEVGIQVIKAMSVKGGPLNRDWRRFVGNEIRIGLNKQQQLEDRFGVSQTILTQIRGFAPNNENWTYNNLFDVNDERIARIGMSDREAGVTFFTP